MDKKIKIINFKITVSEFLKKFSKDKKYFVITHGCQSNIHDSEIIKGILNKIGFSLSDNIKESSIIVINTCAVREKAENKVFAEIGNFKNKKKILILTGCMIMEKKNIDYLKEKFPYVNLIIGIQKIIELPNLLEKYIKLKKNIINVVDNNYIYEQLPCARDHDFKAFVHVTYGCDKFCTYCIVPYTKGRERSRKFDDILNECSELATLGYKEIVLVGQNINSYGKDLNIKGLTFAKLLNAIAKLNIPRISFLGNHPLDFTLDIIDVINKNSNILPYIHLPLQSGDDHILKLMSRKYDSKKFLSLVQEIKRINPNIVFSTDIIIGFPNETTKEFNNTVKMIKKVKFDSAFIFIYSKRSGTPASKLVDKISYLEKTKRFEKINKIINKIIEENNQKYLNNVYDVLVDSVSKKKSNVLTGRLNTNKIVNFNGSKKLIGQIVKVKIKSSHVHYLIGELMK